MPEIIFEKFHEKDPSLTRNKFYQVIKKAQIPNILVQYIESLPEIFWDQRVQCYYEGSELSCRFTIYIDESLSFQIEKKSSSKKKKLIKSIYDITFIFYYIQGKVSLDWFLHQQPDTIFEFTYIKRLQTYELVPTGDIRYIYQQMSDILAISDYFQISSLKINIARSQMTLSCPFRGQINSVPSYLIRTIAELSILFSEFGFNSYGSNQDESYFIGKQLSRINTSIDKCLDAHYDGPAKEKFRSQVRQELEASGPKAQCGRNVKKAFKLLTECPETKRYLEMKKYQIYVTRDK